MGRNDLGHHEARDPHGREQLVAPGQGVEVHQHGPGGVGNIGYVPAAPGTAGEVPEQPGVDGSHHCQPGGGLLRQPVHVIEQPAGLGSAEVGGEREARSGPEAIHALTTLQFPAEPGCPGVLPDDCVGQGRAGGAVPDHRGLPLVGDPHCHQIPGGQARLREGSGDDALHGGEDLRRVVLHPAGPGVDLLELLLRGCHDRTVVIEDHEAGASGPLVDSPDQSRHVTTSLPRREWLESPMRASGSRPPAAGEFHGSLGIGHESFHHIRGIGHHMVDLLPFRR